MVSRRSAPTHGVHDDDDDDDDDEEEDDNQYDVDAGHVTGARGAAAGRCVVVTGDDFVAVDHLCRILASRW